MEMILACRALKEEHVFYKLWSREYLKELLTEEEEDLLEEKEAVLRPLPQRILILALYYPFCAVFTVLYYPLLITLLLVFLPVAGLVHLFQQIRKTL